MAIDKNFVVKNGLEVGDLLLYANVDDAKVGIGSTIPRTKLDVRGGIAATHATVSGVTTVQTALRVGSSVGGTIFTALDNNVVGVGTSQPVFLLDVVSPAASGTTSLYVRGDVRFTGDLDVGAGVSVAGLSTFVGVGTFYEGFISAGIATINQLEVLGFSTFRANLDIASDVGITSTLVVGAGLSVAGISTLTGLTDLNGGLDVTGIATFANNVDINADVDVNRSLSVTGGTTVTGLSTFSSNVDINADVDVNRSLSVTGGATVTGLSTFSSNVDINADVDIDRSLGVTGGATVTGLSTFSSNVDINADVDISGELVVDGTSDLDELNISGLSTFSSNVDINADVDIDRTLAVVGGVIVTGIATIGRVKIFNDGTGGIITATTGIITYYGDASQLSNVPLTGVGIATETAVIGTGITQIDFVGAGISFASANESAGISTIHFSGGREETIITKEEFTATSGQTVFNLATPYDSGYIDVYQEGSKLFSGDFTETDSTTITLTTGATVGDKLQFVNYEKVALNEINPIWRNDGVNSGAGGIYTFTSVGIGTSAQTAFVDVYGGMLVRAGVVTIADSASSDILRITDGGVNIVSGLTTVGTNLHVTGDLNIDGTGTHDIFGTISLDNVAVAAGVTIGQTLEVNGDGHSIDGTTTLGNVNATGIITANSVVLSQNLTVNNDALIQGNLTVNGTTTTLDTTLQEVDLINVQANSATPAIGVTQSGAGLAISVDGGDLKLNDGDKLLCGTGAPTYDLQIYHDGSNAYIDNTTGLTYIRNRGVTLGSVGGETYFVGNANGQVELYYDNSKKFETDSGGITVTGTLQVGTIYADGLSMGDNESARFGNSNDLTILHDGNDSYIDGQGTGSILIRGNPTVTISRYYGPGFPEMGVFNGGGSVDLYYDGSKKFETTGIGVTVTGTLNATTDVQINGTPVATTGKAIAMAMVFG